MLVSYLSVHKHYIVFMEMVIIVFLQIGFVCVWIHLALVYSFCLMNSISSYDYVFILVLVDI